MTQCLCQLFAQINTSYLEDATVRIHRVEGVDCIMELDRFLCGDKFQDLKRLNVSIADYSSGEQDWDVLGMAKSLFPNMEAKGILRVVAPPPLPRMP